jgi:hypothetical protein
LKVHEIEDFSKKIMFLREKIEWEIKKGVLINKESEKI